MAEHPPTGYGDSFPASRKVYQRGRLHPDLRVPAREITLQPTRRQGGGVAEHNPALLVYDTSGPYTDPDVTIDLHAGLAPLREAWIGAPLRLAPQPRAAA